MPFEGFCGGISGGGGDDEVLVFNIQATYFVHWNGRAKVDVDGAKRVTLDGMEVVTKGRDSKRDMA